MLLGPAASRPAPSTDLAEALVRATASLGQRPAITRLDGPQRQEQGFVSLAGWAAKGAHLLRDGWGVGPDTPLGVAGPPGWPLAGACLAAWWLGACLVPADEATVAVVHTSCSPSGPGDVLWVGDGPDGTGPIPTDAEGEAWGDAVVLFPDRPPPASHDGSLPAVRIGGEVVRQSDLLARFAGDEGGALGVRLPRTDQPHASRAGDPLDLDVLAALAVRPLVTGAATVIVHLDHDPGDVGPGTEAAATLERIARAERIVRWLD